MAASESAPRGIRQLFPGAPWYETGPTGFAQEPDGDRRAASSIDDLAALDDRPKARIQFVNEEDKAESRVLKQ